MLARKSSALAESMVVLLSLSDGVQDDAAPFEQRFDRAKLIFADGARPYVEGDARASEERTLLVDAGGKVGQDALPFFGLVQRNEQPVFDAFDCDCLHGCCDLTCKGFLTLNIVYWIGKMRYIAPTILNNIKSGSSVKAAAASQRRRAGLRLFCNHCPKV